MSLREIEAVTGIPKSTIRGTFLKKGVLQKGNRRLTADARPLAKQRTGGVAPFGYVLLFGELVIEPKEFQILKIILGQKQNGKSLEEISKYLNSRGFQTRNQTTWKGYIVGSVIRNHEEIERRKNV